MSAYQHTTLNRKDIHAPVGFKPAFPASKWLQTHALDRRATRNRRYMYVVKEIIFILIEITVIAHLGSLKDFHSMIISNMPIYSIKNQTLETKIINTKRS